jgi:hypothetical protein
MTPNRLSHHFSFATTIYGTLADFRKGKIIKMRPTIRIPIYLSILGLTRAQVLTVAKTYDAKNIFNEFTFITVSTMSCMMM